CILQVTISLIIHNFVLVRYKCSTFYSKTAVPTNLNRPPLTVARAAHWHSWALSISKASLGVPKQDYFISGISWVYLSLPRLSMLKPTQGPPRSITVKFKLRIIAPFSTLLVNLFSDEHVDLNDVPNS